MDRMNLTRPAAWTAGLLSLPLVMNILDRNRAPGDGWHWGPGDFLIMGALIFGALMAYQWLSKQWRTPRARWLAAAAVLLVFLMIWTELAVGAMRQLLSYVFG